MDGRSILKTITLAALSNDDDDDDLSNDLGNNKKIDFIFPFWDERRWMKEKFSLLKLS